MKKIIVLLGIAALTIAPAVAQTKPSKKSQQATEAEEIAKQHDNTLRVLRDGLPLILPSWALPVYFEMNKDEKSEKGQKAKR